MSDFSPSFENMAIQEQQGLRPKDNTEDKQFTMGEVKTENEQLDKAKDYVTQGKAAKETGDNAKLNEINAKIQSDPIMVEFMKSKGVEMPKIESEQPTVEQQEVTGGEASEQTTEKAKDVRDGEPTPTQTAAPTSPEDTNQDTENASATRQPMTEEEAAEFYKKQAAEGNVMYVGANGRPADTEAAAKGSIEQAREMSVNDVRDTLQNLVGGQMSYEALDIETRSKLESSLKTLKGIEKLSPSAKQDEAIKRLVTTLGEVKSKLKPEAMAAIDRTLEFLTYDAQDTKPERSDEDVEKPEEDVDLKPTLGAMNELQEKLNRMALLANDAIQHGASTESIFLPEWFDTVKNRASKLRDGLTSAKTVEEAQDVINEFGSWFDDKLKVLMDNRIRGLIGYNGGEPAEQLVPQIRLFQGVQQDVDNMRRYVTMAKK